MRIRNRWAVWRIYGTHKPVFVSFHTFRWGAQNWAQELNYITRERNWYYEVRKVEM